MKKKHFLYQDYQVSFQLHLETVFFQTDLLALVVDWIYYQICLSIHFFPGNKIYRLTHQYLFLAEEHYESYYLLY